MTKFRARLTFIMMALIGVSMLTAGLFMAKVFEKSHIDELKDNMLREIKIVIATGQWNSSGDESKDILTFSEQMKKIKQSTDARVTYIRADGKVLGDSDENPSLMDNHLQRPEIIDVQSQGVGFAIRYSDTIKENMLYAVLPVPGDNNQIKGYLRLAMSLADIEAKVQQLWLYLFFALLVLFLISGYISYRIARNVTLPIERITRVAMQISNLNYKARVAAHGNDEIGQLGHAINQMADSLQVKMDRIRENEGRLKGVLENMISGVMMIDTEERIMLVNPAAEDILGFTSQELLGKKFNEARQQFEFTKLIRECIDIKEHIREEMIFYFPTERILEINLNPISDSDETWSGVLIVLHDITAVRRLERMRSEFVANVSHELKTPIAAVKGFAETLLAGALNDKETAKSFLQIIFDESERLNRLIGDILELSKIESKRIPLHLSPIHISSLVEHSLQMVKSEASKKQIKLDMDVPDDIFIEGDEDRLRQIMMNLLSNGINYTHEGGHVGVRVRPVKDYADSEYERIEIRISDTGIGIPRKDLPRIFERFYRVDKARSRSSGGTGLGLSIVKHLVEMHQGTIRVDSEVGKGTTFHIELPVLH